MILVQKELLEELRERTIKNFIDILVLTELERGSAMSGHDVRAFIHKEFRILISSGTVYSLLYSLERNELIKGIWSKRKMVYRLTDKGGEAVKAIMDAKEELQRLIARILRIGHDVL